MMKKDGWEEVDRIGEVGIIHEEEKHNLSSSFNKFHQYYDIVETFQFFILIVN